jgi:hypothetical protein
MGNNNYIHQLPPLIAKAARDEGQFADHTDHEEENADVYCDVCALHFNADEPCEFH